MIPHFKPRFLLLPTWLNLREEPGSLTLSPDPDPDSVIITNRFISQSKRMWSTRQFSKLQSGVVAFTPINMEGMENGHILKYEMFGEYFPSTLCTVFKDKFIFVWDMKHYLNLVFVTVFIGWNQRQIFDHDNFLIIPKSIFFDNDNLPISFKKSRYIGCR